MSNEIMPISSSLPKKVIDNIYDLLSETALKKATEYVRKYETETDVILFSEGLIAIRDMLIYVNKYHSEISYQKIELVKKELKLRVKEVDNIICKIRGKRPIPILSDNDKTIVEDIEKSLKEIFKIKNNISFKNIVPFMIESSNKS